MKILFSLVLLILIFCSVISLGLLTWFTYHITEFARYYDALFLINLTIILFLFICVSILILSLIKNIRRKIFGAKLTFRFALSFIIIGIIPGLLVYTISIHFISKSLDTWFEEKVIYALESELNLGKTTLDCILDDLFIRSKIMTDQLNFVSDKKAIKLLNELCYSNGIEEAMIFNNKGRVIAFYSKNCSMMNLLPNIPPDYIMNRLRFTSSYSAVEEQNGLFLRIIRTINGDYVDNHMDLNTKLEVKWLQIIQPISMRISCNEDLQQKLSKHHELYSYREGLSRLYFLTLTIAIILTIFAAVLFALFISKKLIGPLLAIVNGTQAVGVGDYSLLPESLSKDELGILTRSFNMMINQLDEARETAYINKQKLENANIYLESILSNLSSGVLVLDKNFCITMINYGAKNILNIDLNIEVVGSNLGNIEGCNNFYNIILNAIELHYAVGSENQYWQKQFEINLSHTNQTVTLLVRGTYFVINHNIINYLIVFDDITEIISLNRSVAWNEVAKIFAHEIKNPLTPIQLSAERILMNLSNKLGKDDAEILENSITIIVNQVKSLKKMVDDFREYAKTSSEVNKQVDLNHLINEILSLYGWNNEINNLDSNISIDVDLDNDIPYLKGDDIKLRQVIHNLFSNAKDSLCEIKKPGKLKISTKLIKLRNEKNIEVYKVRFIVEDNGLGFNEKIIKRVFEPYVTTKKYGTGLGLAIVRKIIEDHRGSIDLTNCKNGGARISILFTQIYDKIKI